MARTPGAATIFSHIRAFFAPPAAALRIFRAVGSRSVICGWRIAAKQHGGALWMHQGSSGSEASLYCNPGMYSECISQVIHYGVLCSKWKILESLELAALAVPEFIFTALEGS